MIKHVSTEICIRQVLQPWKVLGRYTLSKKSQLHYEYSHGVNELYFYATSYMMMKKYRRCLCGVNRGFPANKAEQIREDCNYTLSHPENDRDVTDRAKG